MELKPPFSTTQCVSDFSKHIGNILSLKDVNIFCTIHNVLFFFLFASVKLVLVLQYFKLLHLGCMLLQNNAAFYLLDIFFSFKVSMQYFIFAE